MNTRNTANKMLKNHGVLLVFLGMANAIELIALTLYFKGDKQSAVV